MNKGKDEVGRAENRYLVWASSAVAMSFEDDVMLNFMSEQSLRLSWTATAFAWSPVDRDLLLVLLLWRRVPGFVGR